MKTIQIQEGVVNNRRRLLVIFSYDAAVISLIRAIPGARWEPGLRCWHVAITQMNVNHLINLFQDRTIYDLTIHENVTTQRVAGKASTRILQPLGKEEVDKIESFRRWMRFRRYSESTIKTYMEMTITFLRFIKPKNADDEVDNDLQRFTNEYILPKKLSFSYQNQMINALKLFYAEIIKHDLKVDQVRRPRSEHKLPNVLSKEEVKMLLKMMQNLKHRAMLSTIYACGLRRGELLNLKPQDIDSKRGVLIIRNAKGKKDRVVPIAGKIVELLREYYRQYRPKHWLFEGIKPGTPYDERSLQQVLKKAIFLAKIKKTITLHWLRHSYATHLHESGVDIRFIQELLGHKSSKTTEIYTHVSTKSLQNIRSPFEDL
jgi:integrase/recombinase XerD